GVGAFQPVLLKLDGLERFENNQVFYKVLEPAKHAGKHIVVLGGGDSALDWTLALADKAASMTLIHRSDKFRAANASVNKARELEAAGKLKILAGHTHAYEENGGRISALKVKTATG